MHQTISLKTAIEQNLKLDFWLVDSEENLTLSFNKNKKLKEPTNLDSHASIPEVNFEICTCYTHTHRSSINTQNRNITEIAHLLCSFQ